MICSILTLQSIPLNLTAKALIVSRNSSYLKHLTRRNFHNTKICRGSKTESTLKSVPRFKISSGLVSAGNRSWTTNVELDNLELDIESERVVLNLTWLRDSCHCSNCTHQHSRQRLFNPKDFRKDIFTINDIRIVPLGKSKFEHSISYSQDSSTNSCLNITWGDNHESFYSIEWLRNVGNLHHKSFLQSGLDGQVEFPTPMDGLYSSRLRHELKYWNVSLLEASLEPIRYSELIDGFKFNEDVTFINANNLSEMSNKRRKAMENLTRQLTTLGLAKIVQVPIEENQVLKIAQSIAYERPTGYGRVFDVTVQPNEEINLAYSSLEFDLHSDLTYREKSPGVQLLHCIRGSSEGGLSYFSDAYHAAQTLRSTDPDLFYVLMRYPITFIGRDPYRDIIFRNQRPVIELDYQGNLSDVYYSPFTLPPVGYVDDIALFYLAMDRFTQLLQDVENKFITRMDPGELFIFHNRRVLHGRSAYDAKTCNRFLQGCYMDWDEIRGLDEKFGAHRNKT